MFRAPESLTLVTVQLADRARYWGLDDTPQLLLLDCTVCHICLVLYICVFSQKLVDSDACCSIGWGLINSTDKVFS